MTLTIRLSALALVAFVGACAQSPTGPTTPLPLLGEGEARFVGDPVALVIADDRYLAEDAAELVVVDYQPLPAFVDYAASESGISQDRARMNCLPFDYEEAGSTFRRSKDEGEKALHEFFRADREIDPRVVERDFDTSCLIHATGDIHKLDALVVPLFRVNSGHVLHSVWPPARGIRYGCQTGRPHTRDRIREVVHRC